MVGARAIPLSAISGKAAPTDGTATSGTTLSAKTSDIAGSRSPAGPRQSLRPEPEATRDAADGLDGDQRPAQLGGSVI